MLVISKNSNLLEQDPYRYSLQNISEPHLYREFFPYDEVPRSPLTSASVRSVCRSTSG